MALPTSVLHKRLKQKKGFVLVYALIALLLAMMVIALLVTSTTMYYDTTNKNVGEVGALAAVQSGVDVLEYRLNESLPHWYGVTEIEELGITNIEELRQRVQEEIVNIDNKNKVTGSNKNAVKLLTTNMNYRESGDTLYRDNVSSGVTLYVCKDGMTLKNNGELEVLVVGSYILNSNIYYKVATVTVLVDADEVDHTGIIKSVKLKIIKYKEGIEGGTTKWGKVQ